MTDKTDDMSMGTDTDLRSRVVALEQGAQAIVPRVTALETWQRQQDIADARREATWTALIDRMNEKFTSIEAKIAEVAGTLKWIGRTIIGAIVVAVVAFLVAGGFHVP